MLVAFFGDTHGNLNVMYDYALAWEARTGFTLNLIVQLGDFGFWLADDAVDKMTAKHTFQANEVARAAGKEVRSLCGNYPEYLFGGKEIPRKTLAIRGNHEDQEYLLEQELLHGAANPEDYLTKAIELVPNLLYLPDGHVVDIDGVKFGGLGGCFSHKTFQNWDYWDPAATEERFRDLLLLCRGHGQG